jgi:transposase
MTGHSQCFTLTHRNTTVIMTRTNDKQTIEVVSVTEKAALVRQTYEPGVSVSLVARQNGVGASQLFNWRKLDREGALTAVGSGESVVSASELAVAGAQISQLQRLLGKKTMENEILKEAVNIAREKNGYCARPC